MIVTDKKYYMEDKLIKKINLMIKRTTGKNKFDNVLLIDGTEGYGKSNMAAGVCYYFAEMTERVYDNARVFFDLEKLIDFAIKTEKQVLHWDEGALGGLAIEWWEKNQKKFMKFLMIARKRQHFFVICIPKFFKLNEYLVVDRSIALIHVYAKKETKLGRFCYFNQKQKEKLYYDWKRKRLRNYNKLKNFRGTFGLYLKKVLNEEEYEKEKDISIMSIEDVGNVDPIKIKKEVAMNFMKNLKELDLKIKKSELERLFGVSHTTITTYTKELREMQASQSNN